MRSRFTRQLSCFVVLVFAATPLFAQGSAVTYSDVTAASGIKFKHNAGKAGKKYLPETLGSGGAFLDADGDGWLDLFLVNSKDWAPRGRKSASRAKREHACCSSAARRFRRRSSCGGTSWRGPRKKLRGRGPTGRSDVDSAT